MGLTLIGASADHRRTEPPPTKNTGSIGATCRRGLRPPMGLTANGGQRSLYSETAAATVAMNPTNPSPDSVRIRRRAAGISLWPGRPAIQSPSPFP